MGGSDPGQPYAVQRPPPGAGTGRDPGLFFLRPLRSRPYHARKGDALSLMDVRQAGFGAGPWVIRIRRLRAEGRREPPERVASYAVRADIKTYLVVERCVGPNGRRGGGFIGVLPPAPAAFLTCYNGGTLVGFLRCLFAAGGVCFRSRCDTALEALALRQQLAVLKTEATLAAVEPSGPALLDRLAGDSGSLERGEGSARQCGTHAMGQNAEGARPDMIL